MTQSPNYEAFNSYIERVIDTPFRLGKFDCLIFTNNATRELNGIGWADPYLDVIVPRGKYQRTKALLERIDARSGLDALDSVLHRVGRFPPVGALLAARARSKAVFDVALGVCVGSYGLFISPYGLQRIYNDEIIGGWV